MAIDGKNYIRMSENRNVQTQKTELKVGVKVEMVLDMPARRKKEEPYDFFWAFQVIEDLLEIGRAMQILRFLVVIHARSARKNRVLATHRVQGDTGPFPFMVRSWLRRFRNFAQHFQIAFKEVNVVSPWQANSYVFKPLHY